MGKYRFIAIDVDGTLLDDNDKFDINRLNKDIELLQQQNYHFITARLIQLRRCNSFILLLSIRSLALTSYLYLAKHKQSLPSSIAMFQSLFIPTTHIFLTFKKSLSQFIT